MQSSVNVHTSNLYSTLWDAAEKLGDDSVLVRLSAVPNGDLVAAEARYHRKKGCLIVNYIKNASAQKDETKQKGNIRPEYKSALDKLKRDLNRITTDHEVFTLSKVNERYKTFLKEENVSTADEYQAFQLKATLTKEWENVFFISMPGKTDLICSSEISVGEALSKANRLVTAKKNQIREFLI